MSVFCVVPVVMSLSWSEVQQLQQFSATHPPKIPVRPRDRSGQCLTHHSLQLGVTTSGFHLPTTILSISSETSTGLTGMVGARRDGGARKNKRNQISIGISEMMEGQYSSHKLWPPWLAGQLLKRQVTKKPTSLLALRTCHSFSPEGNLCYLSANALPLPCILTGTDVEGTVTHGTEVQVPVHTHTLTARMALCPHAYREASCPAPLNVLNLFFRVSQDLV